MTENMERGAIMALGMEWLENSPPELVECEIVRRSDLHNVHNAHDPIELN